MRLLTTYLLVAFLILIYVVYSRNDPSDSWLELGLGSVVRVRGRGRVRVRVRVVHEGL